MRLRAKAQAVTGLRPQYRWRPCSRRRAWRAARITTRPGRPRPLTSMPNSKAESGLSTRITRGAMIPAHHRETLRQAGQCVNHKTVQKLMQVLGLKSGTPEEISLVSRRPCPNGTESVGAPVRGRQAEQKWVTDVTEFNVRGQKLYLSPVMDLYNGEILAYETSRRPMFKLVGAMLKKALPRLSPHRQTRLALRSGLAVSAVQLQMMLEARSITQSMSRKRKLPG